MRRNEALRWAQLKVGILVLVGFLILLWVAFNSDVTGIFRRQHPLVARFTSAEGLVAGSPVFFLGMETGRVQAVDLDPAGGDTPIRVTFEVRDEVRRELHADASARIASIGILGDKHLELVGGEATAPLPEDAVLTGRSQTAFTDLIEPGRRTLTRVDDLLADLETITIGIKEGRGSLGKLLADDDAHASLVGLLDETRAALAEFRGTQRSVGAQLASAAGSLDSLAGAWRRGRGTLQRLAEDPTLYENLNATTSRLAAATDRLERVLVQVEEGDGLLARMLADRELADEVTGLVVDLRALMRDVRENPGRYVQLSVF